MGIRILQWAFLHDHLFPHIDCFRYDVVVNAMPMHELEERFASLTRRASITAVRPPQIVLATEDTCWIGSVCTHKERDVFVRARQLADSKAQHRFMHSQVMGTRAGLLDMIDSGLRSGETDDMKMMFDYIVADPTRVAFDDSEAIFATFARGLVSGPSTSKVHDERSLMCWDGVCAIDRNLTKAAYVCSTDNDGSVTLRDMSKPRNVRPLMWHVNGPSIAFLSRHPTCAKGVEGAKGWKWAHQSGGA